MECVFACHSNIAADQMLYTEKDLEKSMDKIETVNFHQVRTIMNIYQDQPFLCDIIPYIAMELNAMKKSILDIHSHLLPKLNLVIFNM